MIELENTYLIKTIPNGLFASRSREIIDVYLPASEKHPRLRLRENGDKYEMTKKQPVTYGDASRQEEQTIVLTEIEFDALNQLEGKRARKIRYYYDYKGNRAEVDVFQDDLAGLVLVDFEFDSVEKKDAFQMPEFCLADVTQDNFLAGGMLCGKRYADIENELQKFNYQKIV